MKKLLCLLAVSMITLGAFSQEGKMDKKTDSKMGDMKMKDCVIMKDGKMMVMKGQDKMAMDKDMTMSNGTMVMTDGTVKMKDGKTKMLSNNQCVYMDGKMGMMKMHDNMHDKMHDNMHKKDPQ
jgi:hypothetical protein